MAWEKQASELFWEPGGGCLRWWVNRDATIRNFRLEKQDQTVGLISYWNTTQQGGDANADRDRAWISHPHHISFFPTRESATRIRPTRAHHPPNPI